MQARVIKYSINLFKSVGFRFDAYAWYFATQRLNIDLDELDKADSETLLYTLLYSAHESYCKSSVYKRNRYTQEQFTYVIKSLKYWQVQELIKATANNETDKEVKKKSLKWSEVIAFYCGQCNLSLDTFFLSSWDYLKAIAAGYNQKNIEQWQQTREIVAMIYNVNSKQYKKSSDIIKLPNDTPTEHKQVIITESDVKNFTHLYKTLKFNKT